MFLKAMSKNIKMNREKNIAFPKAAVVTCNYNRFFLTFECIKSLEKLTYPNFDIIVVDNGSTDDSTDKLKKTFPYLILIRNRKNLGLSEVLNMGISEAIKKGAEYVFLVDNDTKDFSENYLEEVIRVFEKDKRIGLVGTRNLDYNGNKVWWGEVHEKLGVVRNTPDCGYIVRSQPFKEIGMFDENFFFGFEDLDFIVRLREAGYKTAFVSSVKFAHMAGGTKSRVGFRFHYYRVTAIFLFLKKHGAEWSLFDKIKNVIQLMEVHILTAISCLYHGRIKDFIRVTNAIFRGIIAGLFLFCKKEKMYDQTNCKL